MNRQKQIRVLVVEDDFLVGQMIQGLLEELGYSLAGKALDSYQALQMTQRLQPDVILMDIGMSDIDGIQTTRQIQASHPTPVVVLTAYEIPELVEEATLAGIGAYLVKPPRAREVERAIIVAMARFNDMLELRSLNEELEAHNRALQEALAQARILGGLLPICASCKQIRDDQGYWHRVEDYLESHSEAEFTHGLCPDCSRRLYPQLYEEGQEEVLDSSD
jgi:AmiR/NasT family two-component response regulator